MAMIAFRSGMFRSIVSLIVIVLVIFGARILFRSENDPSNTKPEAATCDIHVGPCQKVLGPGRISLEIDPKPVAAMKDLKFRVTLQGIETQTAPSIDLGMPGMEMGPNHVIMTQIADQTYEGEGIIVRCPSGRKTWFARVNVADFGSVEFVFDVVE